MSNQVLHPGPFLPLDHPVEQQQQQQLQEQPPPTPPPPAEPRPWMWQCRQCHHTYELAATTRCVLCGLRFYRRGCPSTFDGHAWKRWADWQDEVALRGPHDDADGPAGPGDPQVPQRSLDALRHQRWQRFIRGRHDCLRDCSYPGQCGRERYEALYRDRGPPPDRGAGSTESPETGQDPPVDGSSDPQAYDVVEMLMSLSLLVDVDADVDVDMDVDVDANVGLDTATDTPMDTDQESDPDVGANRQPEAPSARRLGTFLAAARRRRLCRVSASRQRSNGPRGHPSRAPEGDQVENPDSSNP